MARAEMIRKESLKKGLHSYLSSRYYSLSSSSYRRSTDTVDIMYDVLLLVVLLYSPD